MNNKERHIKNTISLALIGFLALSLLPSCSSQPNAQTLNPNVRIELPINCTDENTENDSVSLMFQLPSDGKFAGPDNWIFQKNNEGIKVLKQGAGTFSVPYGEAKAVIEGNGIQTIMTLDGNRSITLDMSCSSRISTAPSQ